MNMDVDREILDKTLYSSIVKALNVTECAVKEKHARIVVIASHKDKSGQCYWAIVKRLPLQENPLTAWKFCHVTHKLLRDGHPNVLKESLHSITVISDLGKLWGHLREGYGILIASYARLLQQKLIFHQKNPLISGNLVLDDEQLDRICKNDINSYFELSVDMLDYMDNILHLQKSVFNSMDMSRSNSMTNSGQCKLAPLILCIQDSCQLYHFLVQILFRLHSTLSPDILSGHRDRFYKQFNLLKQFYINAKNLQYFKNLIQIPDMPNSSPNFLKASELSSHVRPMALVSEPEEYGSEIDKDDQVVSDLVDTSLLFKANKNDDVLALQSLLEEKNLYIENLVREVKELKLEIDRIRKEDKMVFESLHCRIQELENEVAIQKEIFESSLQENQLLKGTIENIDKNWVSEDRFNAIEKIAKLNEEKFFKMKEVYGKLREEHVQLLRSSSESSKQLASEKKTVEVLETKYQTLLNEFNENKIIKSKAEEEEKELSSTISEQLSSALQLNKSLINDKQMLENKLKGCEDSTELLNKLCEEQKKEILKYNDETKIINEERILLENKLINLEKANNDLTSKLTDTLAQHVLLNENLFRSTTEKEKLTSSINLLEDQKQLLSNELQSSTSKINDLVNEQLSLKQENTRIADLLNNKTNQLDSQANELKSIQAKLVHLEKELSESRTAAKESNERILIVGSEKNMLENQVHQLEIKFTEAGNQLLAEKSIRQQESVNYLQDKELLYKNFLDKLVCACQIILKKSLSENENIQYSSVNCSADFVIEKIKSAINSLLLLDEVVNLSDNKSSEVTILLDHLIDFTHSISDVVLFVFAAANTAPVEDGKDLTNMGKVAENEVSELFNFLKPDYYSIKKYVSQSMLVKKSLQKINEKILYLLPKIEDVQADNIGDLVEAEMLQTTKAIEQASSRLAEIIASSRSQQSGLQLEVSEKIFDSCSNLMMKIKVLIEKSKLLQKEIVSQGRSSSAAKDFYKRHHQWTEGLISAAKAVGFGANVLVDAADKVVGGKGKFEELVVCAQEIAAGTAQLVVASKVKAERGSENLAGLSDASKKVSEATGVVVASAKSAAQKIEDMETFDFSKLSLNQAKRKEMDSQVRVLELESSLEKERRNLAELRRVHYQLAGEDED